VSKDEKLRATMKQFGELTGIAFQIKDDLFDYGTKGDIGKPTGIDIKEKKMTLPLIYALARAEKADRRRIINIMKHHNEEPDSVAEVIAYVHKSGGIEYASEKMYEYRKRAISMLDAFPESTARTSLHDLLIYTTERNK
jgi:octaprenyl-diphosphate synthase